MTNNPKPPTLMRDDRDYKLDLSSTSPPATTPAPTPPQPAHTPRPWISVHFTCCNVYLRIYKTPNAPTYHGACPRCAKQVHFTIGQGGTSQRFFKAQ